MESAKLQNIINAIAEVNRWINEFSAVHIPDNMITDLRRTFDDFFPDYKCKSVFITNNTDKDLYGAYVFRDLNVCRALYTDDMRHIMEGNDTKYSIDIDSKLFSMGFNEYSITALLMYDLYRILSVESLVDVVQAIDYICANRRGVIHDIIDKDITHNDLAELCGNDYIYRKYSIFAHNKDELVRIPDLLVNYNLCDGFDEVCERLFKVTNADGREFVNPALSLNWLVFILCSTATDYNNIIEVLNDYNSDTASTLIQNYTRNLALRYRSIDIRNKKKALGEASLFTRIRKSGLKSLENDLFEYEMRVKNIEDENSAIFLMRQINSRMGIIQDYLEEENLSEAERRRWENIFYRYDRLRVKMTSKPIYSRKMYGLFTDYNALMQPGAENLMTMNTVY